MTFHASKMEIVKCEIPKDVYAKIAVDLRESINVKDVDVDEYDYSDDEKWQMLKKESRRAYVKLKEREFKLRNNL